MSTESYKATDVVTNLPIVIVDGTHSSGKTTVIRDYIDSHQIITDPELDFGPTKDRTYPNVCVAEEIGGLVVPVVISAESATIYAGMHPSRNVLTSGYNRIDQGAITIRALIDIYRSRVMASFMARKLQPDNPKPIGIALADRGPLSGIIYGRTSLPEQDHFNFRANQIFDLASSEHRIDLQVAISEFCRQNITALLTDYEEIPFEAGQLRKSDMSFRSQVAAGVESIYHQAFDTSHIYKLRGSRVERHDQLKQRIRDVAREYTE